MNTAINTITPYIPKYNYTFLSNYVNEQFRCMICNKLLALPNQKGVMAGEIKCPRCHSLNEK